MARRESVSSIIIRGKCSTFGGPDDHGVAPDEGLAMFPNGTLPLPADPRYALFLTNKPIGTTGLARRLDPSTFYCAIRYPYQKGGVDWRDWAKLNRVTVHYGLNSVECWIVDWGPHVETGREIDLSPGAAKALGACTDDVVEFTMNRGL